MKKTAKIQPLYSEAANIFNAASQKPTCPEHSAYMNKKGLAIEDMPEARFGTYYDTPSLLIPIKSLNGNILSIQYIYEDKDSKTQKRFLKDADKSGGFLALDPLEDANTIYVAEGYATAVSLKKLRAAFPSSKTLE